MVNSCKIDKTKYDVIIIGTGLTQSLISAACSMAGKSVLHLDSSSSYGANLSTLSLNQFIDWHSGISQKETVPKYLEKGPLRIRKINPFYKVPSSNPNSSPKKEFSDELKDLLAKDDFHIEISPHLIYSAGRLVQVIRNCTKKYLEFTSIGKALLYENDSFENISSTKSDIFKSETLAKDQKHHVYRFIGALLGNTKQSKEIQSAYASIFGIDPQISRLLEKPLGEINKHFALPESVSKMVNFGMANIDISHPLNDSQKEEERNNLLTTETKAMRILPTIRLFLLSSGVHGPSPFIYPLYGCNDIVQAFCRKSAVHGGTFVLDYPIDSLKIADSGGKKEIKGVIGHTGQFFECKNLVIGASHITTPLAPNKKTVTRAVCITNRSLTEEESFSASICPKSSLGNTYRIGMIQLSHTQGVCPEGTYLTYLSSPSHRDSSAELEKLIGDLFLKKIISAESGSGTLSKPKLLYHAVYGQQTLETDRDSPVLAEYNNLCVVDESDVRLGFDQCAKEAEVLLGTMYREETFFERSPPKNAPIAPGGLELEEYKEEENFDFFK